jgi:ABC-type bacteriocin/lantibiotic exporter with double-glycine peptidase domain
MQPDIRPWYHLLYVTDQIKSADQKAYIAVGVLCMVVGFTNQSIAKVIALLTHGNIQVPSFALLLLLVVVCLVGFVATLSEFYRIIFPKVNNARYLKNKERSAIFWNDVASMPFDAFKTQYMENDREDDLIVQIYVLSQIAQVKFRRIGRLFTYTIFTTAFVFILFLYAKSL